MRTDIENRIREALDGVRHEDIREACESMLAAYRRRQHERMAAEASRYRYMEMSANDIEEDWARR